MKFFLPTAAIILVAAGFHPVAANPMWKPPTEGTLASALTEPSPNIPNTAISQHESTNSTTNLNTLAARHESHRLRVIRYAVRERWHIDWTDKEAAGEDGFMIRDNIIDQCPEFNLHDWHSQDTKNVGFHIKFSGHYEGPVNWTPKAHWIKCVVGAIADILGLDPDNEDELEFQHHP